MKWHLWKEKHPGGDQASVPLQNRSVPEYTHIQGRSRQALEGSKDEGQMDQDLENPTSAVISWLDVLIEAAQA